MALASAPCPLLPLQLELYKTNMAYARADFLNLQQRTKAEKERAEKFALQVGHAAVGCAALT